MNTKTNTTVCYDCKHFHNEETSGPRKDIWYNHYCKASPLPMEMNPVTGEIQATCTNDLGTKIYTDRGFRFCRDINDGNCELWETGRPNENNKL